MAGHGGKLSRIQAEDYLPSIYRMVKMSHRPFAYARGQTVFEIEAK
jgi:hypothetical protein